MDALEKNKVRGRPTLSQILFVEKWLDKYNIPYYRADITWYSRPNGSVYMFEVNTDREITKRQINTDPELAGSVIPKKITIRFTMD
ncbi:MAG TPA: hypothetical protein VE870_06975 [Bacteroidales bacterium]|nr:hypothetical protein [Bacteroidales bacterium]